MPKFTASMPIPEEGEIIPLNFYQSMHQPFTDASKIDSSYVEAPAGNQQKLQQISSQQEVKDPSSTICQDEEEVDLKLSSKSILNPSGYFSEEEITPRVKQSNVDTAASVVRNFGEDH